jgi:hypothetical protein
MPNKPLVIGRQANPHDMMNIRNLRSKAAEAQAAADAAQAAADTAQAAADAAMAAAGVVQSNLDALVAYGGVRIKEYRHRVALADDGTFTLPFELTAPGGWGMAFCGNNEYSMFRVSGSGVVVLFNTTANVVANADTDTKFCICTAAAQDPMIFKNRLGASAALFLVIWYV